MVPVRSWYRWKGEFCDDGEHLLIAKTRKEQAGDVIRAIRTLHPYEVPEIIVLPVTWRPPALPRLGARGNAVTMISLHPSIQVVAGEAREKDDAVVVEDRFEPLLNDRPVTEMVASRDQLRELGAGDVVSEGLVRCVDKVTLEGDRILVYSDTGCDLKWVKRETCSSGGLSFITTPPKNVSISG